MRLVHRVFGCGLLSLAIAQPDTANQCGESMRRSSRLGRGSIGCDSSVVLLKRCWELVISAPAPLEHQPDGLRPVIRYRVQPAEAFDHATKPPLWGIHQESAILVDTAPTPAYLCFSMVSRYAKSPSLTKHPDTRSEITTAEELQR
jgi:hypothetical protein